MWKKYESGQSLLIIVLLISIVFTIIATASYRLTTETQSTRLQEESIKTLAAADSGIERGVQYANDYAETDGGGEVTFLSVGITPAGVNVTESTLKVTSANEMSFLSPLRLKDEQWTYYLHKYPNGTASISNNIYVYFSNAACAAGSGPAIEITLIYDAGTGVRRWIADPCNLIQINNNNEKLAPSAGKTIAGTALSYRVTIPVSSYANSKLLIVRVIGAPSYLGFEPANVGGIIYSQGQTITSKAVSTNGVTKIATLFKSYPQIPADFFVTRF